MNEVLENVDVGVAEDLKVYDLPKLREKLEHDVAKLLIEFCDRTGLDVLSLSLERSRSVGFGTRGIINRLQIVVGLE